VYDVIEYDVSGIRGSYAKLVGGLEGAEFP
jgi:hypothetical protein